jgi:hypothetical protein
MREFLSAETMTELQLSFLSTGNIEIFGGIPALVVPRGVEPLSPE